MKKKLLFLSLIIGSISTSFAQVNIQWQARYTSGGTGNIIEQAKDLTIDASGNVYVCGTGRGSGGTFDFVTIKYNSAGAQQWVKYFDGAGAGYDDCRAIAVDGSGNVVVTGWSDGGAGNYNAVTVKYDATGTQQWAKSYDDASAGNDEGNDVCVDASGNVYVAGAADGTGSQVANYLVIKYSSAGVQTWAKTYDRSTDVDQAFKVWANSTTGDVYVTGQSINSTGFDIVTRKYNSAGTVTWTNIYNNTNNGDDVPKDMVVNSNGDVFIVGYSNVSGVIDDDIITIMIPTTGTGQTWAKTVAGTAADHDFGNAITLDAAGNVLVTGVVKNTSVGEDVLTAKYDAAGTLAWKKVYNGPANNIDEGVGVTTDATGDVYVTGISYVTAQNNNYVTIKYLSASGTLDWLTKYNGTGNGADNAIGLSIDANLNVFVSGTSLGVGTNTDMETIKYCQLKANAGIDTSICAGGTAALVASAPNAASYVWTDTLGNSVGSTANVNVTPGSHMTYVVAITNTLGCTDLDTVRVGINPPPGPVITASPATSACIGDTITLTANTFPGYLWSTTEATPSIKVTGTGTYSLTVTDTNSCQAVGTINITIHNLPAVYAGVDTGVCSSNTMVLCGTGALNYSWSDGPLNTISDTTLACPTIAPGTAVNYALKGTDAFGCVNYDTVHVQIYPLPPLPTISNGPILTANSTVPVTAYQWYDYNCATNASSAIGGANAQTYTISVSSCYVIEITDTNGCKSSSSPVIVTVGIDQANALVNYSLYPNPAGNTLTLNYSAATNEKLQFSVYTLTGQKVLSNQITYSAGATAQSIDISSLSSGVYLVEVINGKNERGLKKLVKE